MANAYIFYGKAGSGKGTQAKLLKDHLESLQKKTIIIEAGAHFRAFAQGSGFVQEKTKETINSGKLMPAFMPIYLWAKALIETFTTQEEIIFDGVARKIEEAPILDSALEYLGFEKVYIFHVHISDTTALERMQSRAQLAGNAARSDDMDVHAAQARLDAYREQVMPVVEYFKAHPLYQLIEINGEVDVPQVFEQIKGVVM